MRSLLVVLTIALAGCGDDGAPADLGAPDLAVGDLAQAVCTKSCGTCASGTTCVTNENVGINFFSASCLAPCQTDADCTQQRACVSFDGSPPGSYCLSTTEPQSCGPHCDLIEPASSCEGATLVKAYLGIVCGLRHTHCANGCVEDTPDAGVNNHAHCL
jgi:hypothetical protein